MHIPGQQGNAHAQVPRKTLQGPHERRTLAAVVPRGPVVVQVVEELDAAVELVEEAGAEERL